jgi:hypothetical protein
MITVLSTAPSLLPTFSKLGLDRRVTIEEKPCTTHLLTCSAPKSIRCQLNHAFNESLLKSRASECEEDRVTSNNVVTPQGTAREHLSTLYHLHYLVLLPHHESGLLRQAAAQRPDSEAISVEWDCWSASLRVLLRLPILELQMSPLHYPNTSMS